MDGPKYSSSPGSGETTRRNTRDPLIESNSSFDLEISDEFHLYAANNVRELETSLITNNIGLLNSSISMENPATKLDLNFEQLFEKLVDQFLGRLNLPLSWKSTVREISRKVSQKVNPNSASIAHEMNVGNYFKIKCISGGTKVDCSVINGLAFGKNVTHRKMFQDISKPRILLLSCPIVYQQQKDQQFTSLDSIVIQEKCHLTNQVKRISARQPDIVVVDKTVARYAQELMLALGITLVSKVKTSLLESLAKFTGAHIVKSLDDSIPPMKLGSCHHFYVKSYDGNKTIMFFDGCSAFSGCTIILRGSQSLSELKKLKEIVSFAIGVQYNWRLERSFLADCFASPPTEKAIDLDASVRTNFFETSNTVYDEPIQEKKFHTKIPYFEPFERKLDSIVIEDDSDPLRSMMASEHKLNETVDENLAQFSRESFSENSPPSRLQCLEVSFTLTQKVSRLLNDLALLCSPLMELPLPLFLLASIEETKLETLQKENLTDIFPKLDTNDINRPKQLRVEHSTFSDMAKVTEISVINHPILLREQRTSLFTEKIFNQLTDFRARGSSMPKTRSIRFNSQVFTAVAQPVEKADVLDPRNHQGINALFMKFSLSSSDSPFCIDPYIQQISFYGAQDLSLGIFLRSFCFNSAHTCPATHCTVSIVDHVTKFVHESGLVSLSLRKIQNSLQPAENSIITWSWCPLCKTSSLYRQLSNESLSLSFGKFLELKFHAFSYRRSSRGSAPACMNHSLFHDSHQFFAYGNTVACFQYKPVEVYGIGFPASILSIDYFMLNSKSFSSFMESTESSAVKLALKDRLASNIREDDPGSLIAYSLASEDYERQLTDLLQQSVQIRSSPQVKSKIEKGVEPNSNLGSLDEQSESSYNSVLIQQAQVTRNHITIQFNGNNTKFSCCVHFAEQFRAVRSEFFSVGGETRTKGSSMNRDMTPNVSFVRWTFNGIEEFFIQSLSNCFHWSALGGKSGAIFFKSSDDMFVLKETTKTELDSFSQIANSYFAYLSGSKNGKASILVKIFGVFTITFRNHFTGLDSKKHVVVMENLFYNRSISLKYDLKGSMRNRCSNNLETDDPVLLDENLIHVIRDSPFYIRNTAKRSLTESIHADSEFLASCHIMDYSLLVGVDRENKQLVVGIIDYIRQYTLDKKIERIYKTVHNHGKAPTVIAPDYYRDRFREKMNQYFLCVPDRWYSLEHALMNLARQT